MRRNASGRLHNRRPLNNIRNRRAIVHGLAATSDARLVGQKESTPETGALPKFNWSEPHAAILVGLTSRILLELVIGIARGFIASGISRTRSTCSNPFSRLAPLT